ncbi:MAG: hypothetical protein H6Q21_2763 [Bacteroidetes bacterium]|nr:hypothetical protein [Bacteroidota bacterium]
MRINRVLFYEKTRLTPGKIVAIIHLIYRPYIYLTEFQFSLLPCKDSNLDSSDPESDVLTNYTTGQFSKGLLFFKKNAKVKRIFWISKYSGIKKGQGTRNKLHGCWVIGGWYLEVRKASIAYNIA